MAARKKSAKITKKAKPRNSSHNPSKEIKALKAQLDYFKNQMMASSGVQLERNVGELNEQLVKLVSININTQSKMTELLIKMTDLVRENRELISLLEESSEEETAEKTGGNENLVFELKRIEKNTAENMKATMELSQYLKKTYTKLLLSKAIGEKMSEMPTPETEEMKPSDM